MYALYKNVSLSTSFSGDDGFKMKHKLYLTFILIFTDIYCILKC